MVKKTKKNRTKRTAFLRILFIVALVIVLGQHVENIYSLAVQNNIDSSPENIVTIAHTEIFGELQRPHVLFNHSMHANSFKEDGCDTCHSMTREGNLIFEFPLRTKSEDKETFMAAYHKQCIGCHRKFIVQKKKSGPVRCGNCHVKHAVAQFPQYPVVVFDFFIHDKHVKELESKDFERSCRYCHHTYHEELVYEEGSEQSCYYCHDYTAHRSPLLATETELTAERSLTVKKISHARCVNCHMLFQARQYRAFSS